MPYINNSFDGIKEYAEKIAKEMGNGIHYNNQNNSLFIVNDDNTIIPKAIKRFSNNEQIVIFLEHLAVALEKKVVDLQKRLERTESAILSLTKKKSEDLWIFERQKKIQTAALKRNSDAKNSVKNKIFHFVINNPETKIERLQYWKLYGASIITKAPKEEVSTEASTPPAPFYYNNKGNLRITNHALLGRIISDIYNNLPPETLEYYPSRNSFIMEVSTLLCEPKDIEKVRTSVSKKEEVIKDKTLQVEFLTAYLTEQEIL